MLSFKEIQTYLVLGYGAIVLKIATKSICKVTFKQKPWKEIIEQGKEVSKQSSWKKQLENWVKFEFLSKSWLQDIVKKWTDRENLAAK